MEQNSIPSQKSSEPSSLKVFIGFLWTGSVIFALFIGFVYGQGSKAAQSGLDKTVLSASTDQISTTPTVQSIVPSPTIEGPHVTPTVSSAAQCSKSGFAQK